MIDLDVDTIQGIVLQAMRATNLARDTAAQLEVSPGAPIFGADSPLDSLGLVGLLLDIEDALQSAGYSIVLSDERAVSRKHSPFRTVDSLVAYIAALAAAE